MLLYIIIANLDAASVIREHAARYPAFIQLFLQPCDFRQIAGIADELLHPLAFLLRQFYPTDLIHTVCDL